MCRKNSDIQCFEKLMMLEFVADYGDFIFSLIGCNDRDSLEAIKKRAYKNMELFGELLLSSHENDINHGEKL